MKKFTKSLLSLAIAGAMTLPVAAIDVQLDGKLVNFPDAAPEITNSRTMVPFRAMAEAMGYTVGWDDATHRVTAEHDGRALSFSIGDNKLYIKETPKSEWKELDMDVAPYINLDRTYVPVRFFAEAFDQTVKWDDENKTAVIYDRDGRIAAIDKDFSIVNRADAAEKTAKSSKTYMEYNYRMSDSDEVLALTQISTKRAGDKVLYELNMDFSALAEQGVDYEIDLPMYTGVSPLFGKYDGLADVELNMNDDIDPDMSYSNGIYDFIGEDAKFSISIITDGESAYLNSPQIDALLKSESKEEGGESIVGKIWLKIPATKIDYEYNTIGEMLFWMFEDGIQTDIVENVNSYLEYLDYLSDKHFTKTNNGWQLSYSSEELTASGTVSSDFKDLSLNISAIADDGIGELILTTSALDEMPDFEPDGTVIDLTEINFLGQ